MQYILKGKTAGGIEHTHVFCNSGNCMYPGCQFSYKELLLHKAIHEEREKWLNVLRTTGRAGDDPERWKKHLIKWRDAHAESERYRLYEQVDDILLYHRVDGETYYKIIEDIKKIL